MSLREPLSCWHVRKRTEFSFASPKSPKTERFAHSDELTFAIFSSRQLAAGSLAFLGKMRHAAKNAFQGKEGKNLELLWKVSGRVTFFPNLPALTPLSALLLLPLSFGSSPSLFRVGIQYDAPLIKMRSLVKIRLHFRLVVGFCLICSVIFPLCD